MDSLREREELRLVIAIDYGTTATCIPPTSATRHLLLTEDFTQVSHLPPLPETEPV